MRGRWIVILLVAFALSLTLSMAGCTPPADQQSNDQQVAPGEPVPYETGYFVIEDGKRVYFRSQKDAEIYQQRHPG